MSNNMAGDSYGSAEWLTTDKARAAGFLDGPGLHFGQTASGEYLRYSGDGHALIVAPPGAGKGIGFVVPNLIFYRGSMVVIDPKGENAKQTAKYRREKLEQEVYVLDPSGVSGLPSASYNPLSWLERSTKNDFIADVTEFSAAVIENGFSKESYWADCAQHLFRGLVLYLAGHDPNRLNLNEFYELSRRPLPQFLDLMHLLMNSKCPQPNLRDWIQEAGAWYLSQTEDHQKYHLGTMQQATAWMGNLGAQRIMGQSDFDFRDIKCKGITVYLCIHPLQINAYRGWFRLLISQAIKGVFEPIGKPFQKVGSAGFAMPPVVFMLDEYARAVGRLASVDNAIPQIRGYGGRFAFVLQSIGQAKEMFHEGWNTFEESCALQMFMHARGDTAEYVSKRLGTKTILLPGSMTPAGRALLQPNEVSARPKEEVIALVEGQSPMLAKRITSYNDPQIKPRLEPSNMERMATGARPQSLMDEARTARERPGATVGEQAPEVSRSAQMEAGLRSAIAENPKRKTADIERSIDDILGRNKGGD